MPHVRGYFRCVLKKCKHDQSCATAHVGGGGMNHVLWQIIGRISNIGNERETGCVTG